MSQNQEIIESKLCAFIDGELDADGRAEIEKHLEANPQHRRLLESLKATRDLIKWLPREAAPPEVAETLNGQLERSVLLDSDGDFLRPSIVPRILAAAAIVVLTAGLGLAVYYTLPKSQKSATPYAIRGSDGAPATGPDLTGGEADRNDDAPMRRDLSSTSDSLKSGTIVNSDAMAKMAPAKQADALALERWAAENRQAIVAVANGASNAPDGAPAAAPAASNAVVMLVRSNTPQGARRQVTDFLVAQKIQWKEAPSAEQAQQPGLLANESARGQMRQQNENAVFGQTARQQTDAQTTAPTTLTAGASQLQEPVIATQPATDRLQPDGGMYVARMSRQQAVSLGNSITQEPAQSAELKDMAGSVLTFEELSAGKPISNNLLNRSANIASVAGPTTEQSAGGAGGGQGMRLAGRFGAPAGVGGFDAAGGGGGRGGGAAGPDTRPVEQKSAAAVVQAAVLPMTAPTTQTSQVAPFQTTQPAEDALEVVILVEQGVAPAPVAPAVTQPATQPSRQPSGPSDGSAPLQTQPAPSRP